LCTKFELTNSTSIVHTVLCWGMQNV